MTLEPITAWARGLQRRASDTRWSGWLAELPAPLLLPAAAVGLNRAVVGRLDLADHPGPGGAGMLSTVVGRGDWDGLVLDFVSALLGRGWSVEEAGRAPSQLGLALAVLGAVFAGRALAGRAGGWAAGACVGAMGLLQLLGLFVGYDMPGLGLASLGLGLALLGARVGLPGLPAVAAGVMLVCLGGAVKETSLPLLASLAAVPLVSKTWAARAGSLAAVAGGFVLGSTWLLEGAGLPWVDEPSRQLHRAVEMPEASLESLGAGLQVVLDAFPEPSADVLLWQLVPLAVVAALVPGGRQLARIGLALAALAGLAAGGVGAGIAAQPRHFLPALLPLFVLAGVGVAVLGSWLARPVQQPVWVLLLLLPFSAGVLLDAQDLLHSYGLARIERGAAPPRLPAPRDGYSGRYGWFVTEGMMDGTDTPGGPALLALAEQLDRRLATVFLRDGRQEHIRVVSFEAGHGQGQIYEPEACCRSGATAGCARELVALIEGSSGALLLPSSRGRGRRLDRSWTWSRELLWAGDFEEDDSGWWVVLQGSGQDALPDCRGRDWVRLDGGG